MRRNIGALVLGVALLACGEDAQKKPSLDAPPPHPLLCDSDAECKQGRCDPFKGCVDCLFDSDCGSDQHCVDRSCHAIEHCSADVDCARGRCNVLVEECVECLKDADCGDSAHCSNSRCSPYTPCKSEMDCAGGLHCDQARSECVACRTDDDCGARAACKFNQCVVRCAVDHDCPVETPLCNSAGLCAQCLAASDCPAVYHCAAQHCELDICGVGSTCSRKQDAVQRCNEVGDGFDIEPCGTAAVCVAETGNPATCRDKACVAGAWDCNAEGTQAEHCSASGDRVISRIDCASNGQVCAGGACIARACTPNARRCGEAGVLVCDALGTSETLEPCTSDQRCDAAQAACVAVVAPVPPDPPVQPVCEPNALGCEAETITRCAADGSAMEATTEDCADSGQACWQGACLPRICQGDFVCVDSASMACCDNGTRLELDQACTFEEGTYCNDSTGLCTSFTCEPAQPLCNGELATSCKNDGSGPRDVGIDCSASSKVCWDGECLPAVCDGQYQCSASGDLLRCVNHSTALTLEKSCGPGTVCDATAGTCRLQKCVPSQPACDGTFATACDATGLGYEGPSTDCALDQRVCDAGACLPVICEAGGTFCDNSKLRRCSAKGTASTLLDTCGDAESCRSGETTCLPRVCSPNSLVCAGTLLTHCAPDGSGFEPGGTDCAANDSVCELGQCRPLICTPNQRFCDGGDVYLCNPTGTDAAIYHNCEAREYCDSTQAGAAACESDVCIANTSACQSETLATCNADGSGTHDATTDCSASHRVCDLSGACQQIAIDNFAAQSTQSFPSPTLHFVILHVFTSRHLSELDVRLSSAGASALTWFVYRADNELGPYTRQLQVSGSATSNNGYVQWTLPGVPLEAGAFYLLGVGTPDDHEVGIPSGTAPLPVSFAQILGGYTLMLSAGGSPAPETIRIGAGEIGDGVGVTLHTGE